MKRSLWLALFVSSLILVAPCQQLNDKETPVFTTGTQFVQVPVIVQRGGKHLSGLTKENFTVLQDGKEQAIASFETVHVKGRSDTFNEFRNADQGTQQIIIIALDTLNTPVLDQAYFRGELIKFLKEARPSGNVFGLLEITRNGIRVIRDFTDDPKKVLAAFENRDASQPASNTGRVSSLADAQIAATARLSNASDDDLLAAQTQFNNTTQMKESEDRAIAFQDSTARIDSLMSLQQLAQALKGLPGRKSMLLVGSGFQFMSGTVALLGNTNEFRPTRANAAINQHLYTWKLLNDASVAVYPIDTRRTTNTAFEVMDTSLKYSPTDQQKEIARQVDGQIIATFQAIAAQTGGKACFFRTDLGNCVREATEDSKDYYLIGFYTDKNNRKPGWHKIAVKSAEKATLRHRQGFVIADIDPNAVRQTDLQLALNSPFAYTALPFSGRFLTPAPGPDKKIRFELRIPPQSLSILEADGQVNFDIVAIARGEGGKEAAKVLQRFDKKLPPSAIATIKNEGISYSNLLDLSKGDYGVWFVVRDNMTGRTGSVVVPLKVP